MPETQTMEASALSVIVERFSGQPVKITEWFGSVKRSEYAVCAAVHVIQNGPVAIETTDNNMVTIIPTDVQTYLIRGYSNTDLKRTFRVELSGWVFIHPQGEFALVREPCGKIFRVNVSSNPHGLNIEPGEDVYLACYHQGRLRDFVQFPVSHLPYKGLDDKLVLVASRTEALAQLTGLFASDSTPGKREFLARQAESHLQNHDVFSWVRENFLRMPPPKPLDLEDLGKYAAPESKVMKLLREAAAKWF